MSLAGAELLAAVWEAEPGTRSEPAWALRLPGGGPHLVRAVRAAGSADRVAVALAAGYRAALGLLLPDLGGLTALAVTEAGGAHPRAIETTVRPEGDGVRVRGTKTFITGGPWAERAVVLASAGEDDGRHDLRCVVVPLERDGVTRHEPPALPIVPELPHSAVTLDVVLSTDAVLAGDGWIEMVRPFRTAEDLCVATAVAAYAVGACRRGAGDPDGLLAVLACAAALSAGPFDDPALHLALQGLLDQVERHTAELDWTALEPDEAERWQRDQAVLKIASGPRRKRAERARATLA